MSANEKVEAARAAIEAGSEWRMEPIIGLSFADGGRQVFGLRLDTRKPGGRWRHGFTVWAKEGQTAQIIADGIHALLAGEVEIGAAS